MSLNRAWIEQHIPHHGRMCLLDEVLEWDSRHVVCRTATHLDKTHPLRSRDLTGREVLGAACGIEYASQAMALHGALAGGAGGGELTNRPEVGFLASVREIRLHVARLDDIDGDLTCEVAQVAGDGLTALYEFALRSNHAALLSGRATVVLDAAKRLAL